MADSTEGEPAMESFERARQTAYFAAIAAQFRPGEPLSSFLITHLLAERPSFVQAVASVTRLRAVLPKPKSINPIARREVEQTSSATFFRGICSPTRARHWTTSSPGLPVRTSSCSTSADTSRRH
jgi:hypothetical protein